MFDAEDDDGPVYLCVPTVKASSYSLGYNFKIPLPPLKEFWIWRSEEISGEGETPNGDDNQLEAEQEPHPVLAINASLGGKLQHPKQRIKVENEETGETELVEVTFCTCEL